MFWKILFSIFAIVCFTDAISAVLSFEHFGDMHLAWASNSIIAGGALLHIGWNR